MEEILISQEQARQFAEAVIADIEGYIEQHLSEYKAFLKSEGYSEGEVSKMAS